MKQDSCQNSGKTYYNCKKPRKAMPVPSKPVGQFIADWVKTKKGVKVPSKLQGTTQCWDLGMRAIEKAKDAGYPVDHAGLKTGKPLVWSKTVVKWEDAQPGDIMQFRGWKQKYVFAGNPHTAVVVEGPTDAKRCKITTYDQNPHPVKKSVYNRCVKTSGAVTIYRLDQQSSRLRLFSASHTSILQSSWTPMIAPLAMLASGTLAMATVLVFRHRTQEPTDNLLELGPLE